MTLDGKHAKRVVQFLADVFANTFKCTAALAVSTVRLVMDQRARELRWQSGALGLPFGLGRCWGEL